MTAITEWVVFYRFDGETEQQSVILTNCPEEFSWEHGARRFMLWCQERLEANYSRRVRIDSIQPKQEGT